MNTSCDISPASLPARSPLSSRWPFTRLQKLVSTPRFVSVDLVDNLHFAPPVNTDIGLLPLPERREGARLMPVRLV